MGALAPRSILHVDMDAFFAAVEVLDNPSLKGKPVIVGGRPESRGVVAAASYEARAFGVHSAMPSATAVKLCPQAVFLPARGERYGEVSRALMAILRSFTPEVEQLSVDEAFLDVTASTALFGAPEAIARTIKKRVFAELGLTCSVGVAPNKFLAKLASDLEKPDGLTVIPAAAAAAATLAPLPVRRIWGVGPRTAERLAELGLTTIGAVAACPPGLLAAELGSWAAELQGLARGEDDRPVETGRDAKSLSRETTFAEFLSDREKIESVLLALADDVAERLRAEGLVARIVTLKVRDETFKTVTRETALHSPTDLGETLYASAVRLFREKVALGGRKVRLLGVGATGLAARAEEEPELFPDRLAMKRRGAAVAVDRVKRKFGEDAVTRARLLKGKGLSGRAGWEGR